MRCIVIPELSVVQLIDKSKPNWDNEAGLGHQWDGHLISFFFFFFNICLLVKWTVDPGWWQWSKINMRGNKRGELDKTVDVASY